LTSASGSTRTSGRRIVEAEQQGKRRANHGDALIKRLAIDLTAQFGRGFGWRNLFQMRAFYLEWPEILQTTSAMSAIAPFAPHCRQRPAQPTSGSARSTPAAT
jgi:hypothetical protein